MSWKSNSYYDANIVVVAIVLKKDPKIPLTDDIIAAVATSD
jgi:hypothetical protein